ncbi:hypothetical protein KCP74_04900 [Salmonella enterica subsp. enterica]|nr:hypothetical protein KCP74_04900 [Salmonella enterica subsp. enterica]
MISIARGRTGRTDADAKGWISKSSNQLRLAAPIASSPASRPSNGAIFIPEQSELTAICGGTGHGAWRASDQILIL